MKREEVIEIAKLTGMKASIGKTTDGKYSANVNALGNSIPVEWLEAFANEVERRTIEKCARVCMEWYGLSGDGYAGAIRALQQQEKQ